MVTEAQKKIIRTLSIDHSVAEIKEILLFDYNIPLTFASIKYWIDPQKGRENARKHKKAWYDRKKEDPAKYREFLDDMRVYNKNISLGIKILPNKSAENRTYQIFSIKN